MPSLTRATRVQLRYIYLTFLPTLLTPSASLLNLESLLQFDNLRLTVLHFFSQPFHWLNVAGDVHYPSQHRVQSYCFVRELYESAMANLNPLPSNHQSSRPFGDVLEGTDAASALVDSCSSRDAATLLKLLAQPHGLEMAVSEPHRIYSEDRARNGDNDTRRVTARPIRNIDWAIRQASENGHAAAVTALLAFTSRHDIKLDISSAMFRVSIGRVIQKGYTDVFQAFVTAIPAVVDNPCDHSSIPLDLAIKRSQTDIVTIILEHGANLKPSMKTHEPRYMWGFSYRSSLLASAAGAKDPHIIELLLKHGLTPAGSGGLHRAAEVGALEIMRLLITGDVCIDEQLPEASIMAGGRDKALLASWTPMHFAASQGKVEAVRLLEESGARTDIKDRDGKAPQKLL